MSYDTRNANAMTYHVGAITRVARIAFVKLSDVSVCSKLSLSGPFTFIIYQVRVAPSPHTILANPPQICTSRLSSSAPTVPAATTALRILFSAAATYEGATASWCLSAMDGVLPTTGRH